MGTLSRLSCEFTQKSQLRLLRQASEGGSSLPPSARKERRNVCNCESPYNAEVAVQITLGNPGAGRWGVRGDGGEGVL